MWKKNKFRNKRVEKAGIKFDSKLESSVHDMLLMREKAKEIAQIRCQDVIYLTEARIQYRPDFSYTNLETGLREFWEAKGFFTPEFNLKKRLWKYYGPGVLYIWGGSHTKQRLIETIIPIYAPMAVPDGNV